MRASWARPRGRDRQQRQGKKRCETTDTSQPHHYHQHDLPPLIISHTSGVADEYGMDDEDYIFVDRFEVEEDDGTWQTATMFRHKVSQGVCLFFGGSDYEGLPDLYTYVDGVLKDGDGEEISIRVTREKDTSSQDKKIDMLCSSSQVEMCDVIDMTVDGDIIDHESEMYMGDGVTPDGITDDLQSFLDEL